ncbi:MAG TPA: LuxR C-terminal-related transcriptional regulator [Lachnospiraceae bacterium]|nr:LuxR C-terminal-related transcriptional regulator [Lachnospiraceae bacterium]
MTVPSVQSTMVLVEDSKKETLGVDHLQENTIPILSMKLKMPEPRRNYIVREELFHQLAQCKDYKVTIVKAGAGSGKTTLLSSFIKETGQKDFRWVTLDENVNQAFVFWKYVLIALKEYLGEESQDFEQFFDCNMQKDILWKILSMLLDKLSSAGELSLVLDDFQMVKDPFLIATIDSFIKNMSDNVHLIFLTRDLPEIYLGTLYIEDSVLILDENDIRLSPNESRAFLLHTIKLERSEEQLQSMIEASGGWIGGLQLLAAASKDRSSPIMQSLTFSNHLIEGYITKEIFQYLSEDEKTFLTQTAILRYFNEEICKRYLPGIEFTSMMESILQRNLFVINIDGEAGVYRYHAILYDYLNGVFDRTVQSGRELHQLAAQIYYEVGDEEESLYHLFAIKDYDQIMVQLLKMPQTTLTFTYMMKVPLEEIIRNRDFAYQYFFCYYASVDIESCDRIYTYLKENMEKDSTFSAFAHADMFFSVNWEYQKVSVHSMEQISRLPLNKVSIAYLLIKEAYFLLLEAEYKQALTYLNRAEEIYKETGNLYIGFFILAEKAQILEDIGNLKEAIHMYQLMLPLTDKLHTLKASYYIGVAGVYTKQLALSKAYESLVKAKSILTPDAVNMDSAYQYTLAEYYYIIGKTDKTEEIVSSLLDQEMFRNIFYSARLLRYPIYRGKHRKLAKQYIIDYNAADNMEKVMDTELLYAGILYEEGDFEQALQVIDRMIAKARKAQNKLKIIEGDLLKARFLSENDGKIREIRNLFIEAVTYANENLIALPFWFEKVTVSKLLTQMGAEIQEKLTKEEIDFVKSILKLEGEVGLEIGDSLSEDLTQREREVLYEMAKGCTNKEIANQLCISLATVKSHVINIYGKLGVNNRVAAINKVKKFD